MAGEGITAGKQRGSRANGTRVAAGGLQVDQQIDRLVTEFWNARGGTGNRHEVDIALLQEGMRLRVDPRGNDTDFEYRTRRTAEYKAHADDQADGKQQRENQRRTIAEEFEVAGVPDRKQASHHVRRSFPVSSRNRSSRFGGRIRKFFNDTWALIRVRNALSTSWVAISTRSLATPSPE